MSYANRYHPADYGDFKADGHGIIGHKAVDVTAWLEDHPEFDGYLYFSRWDFEGEIDVTDQFISGEGRSQTTQSEAA